MEVGNPGLADDHRILMQALTMTIKKLKIVFILSLTIVNISCRNHVDKYKVDLDTLKKLPDNFFAYRRGRIYVEDVKVENYRIWFDLDDDGNVQDIFKVEDFKNTKAKLETVIRTYAIDTSMSKVSAQNFIELSRKYRFGHIRIDKANQVSFSYKDGLAEQYVRTLNDSVKNIYLKKNDFKLLQNGWFENVEH